MNQKTSKWLTNRYDCYCEKRCEQNVVVCPETIGELFDIPPNSEIQLRLSLKAQNQQSRPLTFRLLWSMPGFWQCRLDWGWTCLHNPVDDALNALFPNAKDDDTHALWLTCWYRDKT